MATAKIDHVSMLECSERFGIIEKLVRRARVIDLESTDYTVLMAALAAAGVPAAGARLSGAPNVVLKERVVRLVQEDKTKCDVDLTYGLIADQGQSIDAPPYGILVGKATTTMSQTTTNLDRDGNTIVLSHTYPSDDPDFPGQTIEEGGEIQVQVPQDALSYQGIKTTFFPWLIRSSIKGRVNASAFAGGEPGQWLCTTADYEIADGGAPNRYYFTFAFEFNEDGWQPTAIFTDSRTGKPPVGLVPDVGYKTVNFYKEADFESIVGTRVQGG